MVLEGGRVRKMTVSKAVVEALVLTASLVEEVVGSRLWGHGHTVLADTLVQLVALALPWSLQVLAEGRELEVLEPGTIEDSWSWHWSLDTTMTFAANWEYLTWAERDMIAQSCGSTTNAETWLSSGLASAPALSTYWW